MKREHRNSKDRIRVYVEYGISDHPRRCVWCVLKVGGRIFAGTGATKREAVRYAVTTYRETRDETRRHQANALRKAQDGEA